MSENSKCFYNLTVYDDGRVITSKGKQNKHWTGTRYSAYVSKFDRNFPIDVLVVGFFKNDGVIPVNASDWNITYKDREQRKSAP